MTAVPVFRKGSGGRRLHSHTIHIMKCNLMLHCGAALVDRSAVSQVPVPRPTASWHPVPHVALLHLVEGALVRHGMRIVTQAHSLTHDGLRYFGLVQVERGCPHDDYSWVLGLRNSHDKRFPAGLVAGAQVFVCDNLSFSGEVKIARKHTRHIMRDLPRLAEASVIRLLGKWNRMSSRVEAYRTHAMEDTEVHDLVVRSVDCGVCTITQVPEVLNHWRNPAHEAFKPRTAWSLFNGFTETLKGRLPLLTERTERLHHLLDSHIGLKASAPEIPAEVI